MAAFCEMEVGFEVVWLCSFIMASISGLGASAKPMRQPVMAVSLRKRSRHHHVLFRARRGRDRERLAFIQEAAIAFVGHQADVALARPDRRSSLNSSGDSTAPLGLDGELMISSLVCGVM